MPEARKSSNICLWKKFQVRQQLYIRTTLIQYKMFTYVNKPIRFNSSFAIFMKCSFHFMHFSSTIVFGRRLIVIYLVIKWMYIIKVLHVQIILFSVQN